VSERVPLRILYMEDDPGLARLVQKRLSREGYIADLAEDGEEGLAMYAEGVYDVVIVDQEMPVCSGLKVLEIMAAEMQQLPPTIMLTGTGNEETAVEAMKLGAGDYLVKDAAGGYLDLLSSVIERVLTQYRLVEERQRAEQALKESEARFRAVAQTAMDAIVSVDSLGRVIFWNNGAESMFGYGEEEVLEKPFTVLIAEQRDEDNQQGRRYFELTNKPRREQRVESVGLRKDGSKLTIELSLTSWETNGGTYHTTIIRDITERKEYEEKLSHMAHHDALTGVYNRHYLDELLEQEAKRAERYNHPIGILMIDVNRFKEINDRFGHQVGDKVLQAIAALLEETVRETDIVVRYGGDEFLLICPETNGETETIRERILQAMVSQEGMGQLIDFPVTLSIGSAHWAPGSGGSIDRVLAEADKRMYDVKTKR